MTPKTHFNKIVSKAETIQRRLEELQAQALALIDECEEHRDNYDYDDYIYELSDLKYALEVLQGFDLREHTPDKHELDY
jgi:hypothetical protein